MKHGLAALLMVMAAVVPVQAAPPQGTFTAPLPSQSAGPTDGSAPEANLGGSMAIPSGGVATQGSSTSETVLDPDQRFRRSRIRTYSSRILDERASRSDLREDRPKGSAFNQNVPESEAIVGPNCGSAPRCCPIHRVVNGWRAP